MSGSQALTWLMVFAGAFLLVTALVPLITLHMLLKLQFRYPRFQVQPESAVPETVRAYLTAGAEPLLALGFVPQYWRRSTSMEVSEYGTTDNLMLEHPELGVSANVTAGFLGVGYRIWFRALFTDGLRLETAHGESALVLGPIPGTELLDSEDAQLSALWKAFAARRSQLQVEREPLRLAPEAACSAYEQSLARAIDSWAARGWLQPAREPGCHELTLLAALRFTARIARGNARLARFRAERAKLDGGVVLDSEQIRGYRQMREMSERRSTRFGWAGTFLVTGVLFALSMLHVVPSGALATFLGVLLFHELGHYAAMRVLGYRDTSIFFIPFFGAAARGMKRDATLHEQLLVLLAGPLPGLLLAGCVTLFAPGLARHPSVQEAIEMLIWLNLFNLFPIYPLDGGRMVELLFSGTRPFVEVTFRALGALALLALGVFASSVVLIALAAFLLLSIPAARRAANALRRIRALGPLPKEEDARLGLLLSELRMNQPSLAPARRVIVMMPVAKRLQDGELTWLNVFAWSGVYLLSVCAGGAALLSTGRGAAARPLKPAPGIELACGDQQALSRQIQPGSGTFVLNCAVPQASESMAELKRFIDLPQSGCLSAPWHAGVALTPAQVHARATVAALQAAEASAVQQYWDAHPDTDGVSDELDPTPSQLAAAEARERELGQVLAAALQRHVIEHARDANFDAATAQLYLQPRADEETDAQLLLMLGRANTCTQDDLRQDTRVSLYDRGATVRGYRDDLRSSVSELARYLCERKCRIKYRAALTREPP